VDNVGVDILGLVFAGTATHRRAEMARFVEVTLGLPRMGEAGADMFVLPDGTRFAVAGEREEGRGTSRTIGFLVSNLDTAVAELRAAGVEVDETAENSRYRYAHFTAPDGELYELVQER
jgi:catechol 2,3-dioxygenase-like lactoylglutathione lyase family enzyme